MSRCLKHGVVEPCAGGQVATSKQGKAIYCDPSIRHCPKCGRVMREER